MTRDVRTFPIDAYPEGGELDRLRAEFVQYQFGFHQFSDFYTIVARFAWEKAREAVARDRDGTRSAETACPAPVPQDCQARPEGIAQPHSEDQP